MYWDLDEDFPDMLAERETSWTSDYPADHEPVIQESSEEDLAWTPIVDFLHANTRLKDLIYDCQSQFPPSLLKVLHKQHPQCRIHHLTFRLTTLSWDTPHPYEMELATSPSLFKVRIPCAGSYSVGNDFNLEAVMELASGLAPNLKEVIISDLLPQDAVQNRQFPGPSRSYRPRNSWQSLPGFKGGSLGSLTSLSLRGRQLVEISKMLRNWAKHIDFTCLQQLVVPGYSKSKDLALSGERCTGLLAFIHSRMSKHSA